MSSPSYLQEPQLITLQALFNDLKNGALQVPRFQREFVWNPKRRLELLDSIKKGIPLGSILTLRASIELAVFPRVGGIPVPPHSGGARQYLLDGHQRVSTLFSAFQPEAAGLNPTPSDEWELEPGDIVYDLVEECFVLRKDYSSRKPANRIKGLPLNLLFEGPAYMRFMRDNYSDNDALVERADVLAERFRNYKIPLVPIVTEDLGMALEAFQRVNSSGVIMSDAHIVHALSYSTNFDLMALLEDASQELAGFGWGSLDKKYILAVVRALGDLAVTTPEPEKEAKILKTKPELIDAAVASIRRVADWLWDHCRIASPAFLPYSYQLPLLASVFENLDPAQLKMDSAFYRDWFWKASLTGIFRSMRENDYVKAKANMQSKQPEFESFERQRNVGTTAGMFYFQRARVKIVVLLMVNRRLASKSSAELKDVRQFLHEAGSSSMKNILKKPKLPTRSDAGTKFIAIDSTETAFAPNATQFAQPNDDLLTNPEALARLAGGDHAGFFDARAATIRKLEHDFIATLGLDSTDEDRQN